mgnify:CR=1 FL=1
MKKMESDAKNKTPRSSAATAANEPSPVQDASWVDEEDMDAWDPFGSES